MLPSPSKRRKTSETSAVAVDASQTNPMPPNDNNDGQSQSLNNSNPTKSHSGASTQETAELPARNPTKTAREGDQGDQREQAGGRAFGLRDRKALRPSLTSTVSPVKGSGFSTGESLLSPRRGTSGIQAFAAPPRRVSRKILPSDLTFGSPARSQQRASQRARGDNTPDRQLGLELGSATGETDEDRDLDQSMVHEGFDEPELPPTPTQLGLEKPPGRARGLLSSSPSARHGERGRQRTTDRLQPSPLVFGEATDLVGEAEDLQATRLAVDQEPVSEAILKKQRLRRELAAELQRLKDDIVDLENWAEKLNQLGEDKEPTTDIEAFSKLISSLTSEAASSTSPAANSSNPHFSQLISSLLPFSSKVPPKATRDTSPFPTNPFALREPAQARPYLTVFAPLSLTTHSSKASASKPDIWTETHELTLSAPPPFPPNLYNVTIVYETNPETHSLASVSVPTANIGNEVSNIPEALQQWINSRLASPLLKLDISSLCWGINRYWEAALYRAQIWSKIESKYPKLVTGRTRLGNSSEPDPRKGYDEESPPRPLSISDLRLLVPHLDRTTMLFTMKAKEKLPKILLSCPIALDEWNGEPQLRPEISVSVSSRVDGVSGRKIEQETKKLFRALLNEDGGGAFVRMEGGVAWDANNNNNPDVVVRAIGGVLGVLFGAGVEGSTTTIPKGNNKALGKKKSYLGSLKEVD